RATPWTASSARRWARSVTSRRPPLATCARWPNSYAEPRPVGSALMSTPREKAALTGVSETALMTLRARAREARRPDAVLDDPMAITLVDSIDFDFAK